MAFFKKPKTDSSVRNQLTGLARDIGIETIKELKETAKETLRFGAENKDNKSSEAKKWEEEWLKDKDPNKPTVSDSIGSHSALNLQNQFAKNEQQELKRVQAKLAQMHTSQQEKAKSVYDEKWQERQEKKQRLDQPLSTGLALDVTGSKRPRGDWMRGAKRKHQATPQELNRTEFAGSKGK